MPVSAKLVIPLILTALLGGCRSKPDVPTLSASMRGVMEPQMQAVWDISSKAYNDVGDGLEARKISAADWTVVGKAGEAMRARALLLADVGRVKVAADGEPILGSQAAGQKGAIGKAWDAVSARQVQSRIDANPALFARHAHELASQAADLVKAASVRDTALLYKVSSGMDEVCDGCHEPFWGTDEPPPFPKG